MTDMKQLLALPLLLAALMLPSCSTLGNIQRDLASMSQSEYEGLQSKVASITAITSSRLARDWDAEKRQKALNVIAEGRLLLLAGDQLADLGATDLIRSLADRYGEKMGLDDQARRDIKDAALLLDVLIGPIKLGIDGKLGERELGLLLSLLKGLEYGLR